MTSVLPSRVFITGSSDGLGLMAGRLLAGQGHQVTLHARNKARAGDTRVALPQAQAVVTGDLSSLAGMRQVADQVAGMAATRGRFDAVTPGWVPTRMGGLSGVGLPGLEVAG
jgi:NAD(P)-dependent dehydrogenase (short-subunit alcohol dehydrogenase family)